jgi:hypothetical protein
MAIQDTTLLVLAQNYAGDVKRQINRRSVLLSILPIVPGEGKNVAWVPEADGAFAEFYTESAAVTTYGSDALASAILPWSQIRANFAVTGLAQATSASSRTPVGLLDLWARNMINSASKLATTLNVALYNGAGAPSIVGLDAAIGSVSNTYATIDRSVGGNAYWRPYVVDPGVLTALTFDQIRADLGAIYAQCGMRSDLAMVSTPVLNKMASLFDPLKQYMFQVTPLNFSKDLRTQRGNFTMEGGVGQMMVDGCLFIEDKDATANSIFYMNSEHVKIEYLPFINSGMGRADEITDMSANDGVELLPLGLQVEMLAKTADVDSAFMKAYVQLKVERPNSCGVRRNVAV